MVCIHFRLIDSLNFKVVMLCTLFDATILFTFNPMAHSAYLI